MKIFFSSISILAFSATASFAQSVIAPNGTGVTVNAPDIKGRTENVSVTNGSRTSLSVGNATTFGASANLTASEGLTAVSRTLLAPSDVSITSSIGTGVTTGLTKIDISNLTAKGGGTINPGLGNGVGEGSVINSTEGQFASGNATIDGMGASVNMTIGSEVASGNSSGSEASFYAVVHPNLADGEGACSPDSNSPCAYTADNGLISGNAGASANLSTQTNIDIQANSFTQTFAQSF